MKNISMNTKPKEELRKYHLCEKDNCNNKTEENHAYCRECIYKALGK